MTQHLWCPDYSDCGAVTGIQTLLTAQLGYMLSVATCYQSANSKESALLPRDSARSYRLGAIGPECLTVSLHGHHAVFGHPHSPLLTRGNLHLHWNQQARGPGLLMPGKIVRPVSLKALHESIRLLPSLEPRHCVDGVPTGKPIKRNRFRIVVQVLMRAIVTGKRAFLSSFKSSSCVFTNTNSPQPAVTNSQPVNRGGHLGVRNGD